MLMYLVLILNFIGYFYNSWIVRNVLTLCLVLQYRDGDEYWCYCLVDAAMDRTVWCLFTVFGQCTFMSVKRPA